MLNTIYAIKRSHRLSTDQYVRLQAEFSSTCYVTKNTPNEKKDRFAQVKKETYKRMLRSMRSFVSAAIPKWLMKNR